MVNISNESLVARIGELARRGRHIMVELLSYLAEMERRKLHLGLGYASLFSYCTEELRFSKASAFRCTHAATVMTAFPRVAHMLAEGSLGLTSVSLLREVVSDELLDRAAGKTVEEVRVLVAALKPQPAQPTWCGPSRVPRWNCASPSGPVSSRSWSRSGSSWLTSSLALGSRRCSTSACA